MTRRLILSAGLVLLVGTGCVAPIENSGTVSRRVDWDVWRYQFEDGTVCYAKHSGQGGIACDFSRRR